MMIKKTKIFSTLITTLLLITISLGCISSDDEEDNEDKKTILTVVLPDLTEKEFTLSDLEDMTGVECQGEYQNRLGNMGGKGTYKAALVKDILAESTSNQFMKPGDTLNIIAEDGYTQEFCYYNVYPPDNWYKYQGHLGIAYSFNGKSLDDWSDGPMSVMLPEDNVFTLDDCNATSAAGQGFHTSSSAGARFIKNVAKIEIINNNVDEWSIELKGTLTETFTKTDFEILEQYYQTNYTDKDGNVWSGVPLWRILGRVDDSGPVRGEDMFNETLANNGYQVEVTASDEYSKEIASQILLKNDEIILANMVNNQLITEEKHKPLRVVGESLTSGQMVGKIAKITITIESGPTGIIVLTVIGAQTKNYDMAQLKSMPSITNGGGFKKTTGTIVGPFNYKGVSVSYILEQAGFIDTSYSIEVKASDGYTMVYTQSHVEGKFVTYDSNGDSLGENTVSMMLAYEEVGKSELDGGPLRIVLVGSDSPLTDGHFWAKEVVQIKQLEAVKDWELEMHGMNDYTMDRSTLEALATCEYHQMWYNYTDLDSVEHHYEVVPLWILVSTIDGIEAPNNFYFFNDYLSGAGYNITVTASDGFKVTFHSTRIARNDSIMIAFRDNQQPLSMDNGWPIRIVGPDLSGKESIRNIKYINMTDIPQISEWSFNLSGLTSIKVKQSLYMAMASHHLVWYNVTEKDGDKHYQGIPLYYVLGAVDDGDEFGHFGLNMTLALLGYSVEIKATDGFAAEFDSIRVARNRSIVLAYMNDGQPLNVTEGGPVRIVGDGLSGKESIKNVADITLKNINNVEYSPGILEVIGKKTKLGEYEVNLTLNQLKGFPSYSGSGGYKNKVGNIAGPFNYTGVNISSLLWLVGGLKDGDLVIVTALDGYSKTLSYYEITGKLELFDDAGGSLGNGQVTPMLAYSEDGAALTDGGPVKLVFVTPDGAISSSGYWIKEVVKIEII
jgi:DMSO/TMAO reductase YedYZ molybdopterin-dependent catalytic subunit